METTDENIIESLRREKNEEVGKDFKIEVFPFFTINVSFIKKDGNSMILPHFYAIYLDGDVQLNEEYSEFKWVRLDEISDFEPKINTIPDVLDKLAILKKVLSETKSVIV